MPWEVVRVHLCMKHRVSTGLDLIVPQDNPSLNISII